MGVISSTIQLVDNYSSTASKVGNSVSALGTKLDNTSKKAKSTESAMSKAFGKTHKVNINADKFKGVRRDVNVLTGNLKNLTGKQHNVNIVHKETGFNRIKDRVSAYLQKKHNLKIEAKDLKKANKEARKLDKELKKTLGRRYKLNVDGKGFRFTDKLKGIGSSVKGALGDLGNGLGNVGSKLAGVAGTLGKIGGVVGGVVAAIGVAVGGKMLKQGMDMETEMVSMTHFLGGDEKKSASFLKDLRKEADLTPFETDEVIGAGRRAVQITGGDTEKGMQFVKLAEDMAALNPGKSISDAMEALADADMGEMERLKEFGFKGSKELFDAAGEDLFKMKDTRGNNLMDMYSGGAEKLSQTAKGKLSTVTGNIESGMTDAGLKLLERLSPVLSKLVPLSEELANKIPGVVEGLMTTLEPLGETIWNVLTSVGEAVMPLIEPLMNLGGAILPIVSAAFQFIGELFTAFAPIFSMLGGIINDFVVPAVKLVGEALSAVLGPATKIVGTIIKDVVAPAFKTVGGIAKDLLGPAFDILSGIVKTVGDKLSWFADKVSWVGDKIGGAVDGIKGFASSAWDKITGAFSGENATGTHHWDGGVTKINEQGEEMWNLPNGTAIYPAGETSRKIEKEVRKNSKSGQSKVVNISPTIIINGANKANKEITKDMERELRRLAVNAV